MNKRFICGAMAAAMTVSLAGCAGKQTDTTPAAASSDGGTPPEMPGTNDRGGPRR